MATIKDVAERAGVSPITASRALSGTHPVAEATRRRVLAAAEALGYAPDLLARGLVHRRTPMIGVVVPQLSNPFFTAIIDAIQALASEKEHLVVVSQSERREEMERAGLARLRQMRVAGALVTPVAGDLAHLCALQAEGIAVVVLARRRPDGDYVTVDDWAGGRMAAEHLLGLGHRQVACLALDEPAHASLRLRLQGFEDTLRRGGGDCRRPGWQLRTAALSPEDGARAADAFLALAERPAAVFVTADRLAIGFVHRLRERGLRVPEDVAVVGYDDIQYSEYLEVPLTTVALPMAEMGRLAAEILFERIEHGQAGPPHQVELAPRLVVRASCGALQSDNHRHR